MSHVEKEVLEKLYRGDLPLDEQLEVLEHISSCEYCAAAFAEVAEKMTLMKAPANLKSSIMHQAGALPVQLQTRKYALSKNMQLMLYSMKIGAAVLCSIIMLFTVDANMLHVPETTLPGRTWLSDTADKVTQSIHTFTDQFIHGEVIKND